MGEQDQGRVSPWSEDGGLPLTDLLRVWDPGYQDPTYWARFRTWVLSSAEEELTRRRFVTELTVGDVLAAWARTLVPTALVAAALAGFLILRPAEQPLAPIALDELLVAELGTDPVPIDGEAGSAVAFASERF